MPPRLSKRGSGELVQAQPGSGVFSGYASLFNRRNQAGDIVVPGAFVASLKKRGAENIRMLFQHDPAEPVGTWIEIKETDRGLYVLVRLDKNVQRGRELFSLLESKGLDGLSIGFKTVAATRDLARKARLLTAIDLWEILLVTFPMLEGARVNVVKSRARILAESFFRPSPLVGEGPAKPGERGHF